MRGLGRFLFFTHLPITIVLLTWVWIGRFLFGVGGWLFLFIPLLAGPVVLIAMLIAEIVVFRTPIRPMAFTTPQSVAHLGLWATLFALGVFVVDYGDESGSDASIFTQLVGRSEPTLQASHLMTLVFAVGVILAWTACVVTSVIALRHKEHLNIPVASNMLPYHSGGLAPRKEQGPFRDAR